MSNFPQDRSCFDVHLAAVGRRLAAQVCQGASSMLRCHVQCSDIRIATLTHEAAQRDREPTCCFPLACTPVGAQPCDGGFIEIGPPLAEAAIDVLLGGDGRPTQARYTLTTIDRSVLKPLVELTCQSLSVCLPAGELQIKSAEASRSDSQAPEPAAADTAAPAPEDILTIILTIDIGPVSGMLRVGMPWPLMTQLLSAPAQGDVQLSAGIDETTSPADLASLAPGDLLLTDTPAEGEIIVHVNGVPKFAAKLGKFDGHRAITITRKLD